MQNRLTLPSIGCIMESWDSLQAFGREVPFGELPVLSLSLHCLSRVRLVFDRLRIQSVIDKEGRYRTHVCHRKQTVRS